MNNILQLKVEHFKRTGLFPGMSEPVNAVKFADQVIIDNQVVQSIDTGIDIYKPQLKIVTDYIRSLNDFNDASDNIAKIYKELDNENNADYLTQTLFVSDLTGHLSFQSEIEKEQAKTKALSFYKFQAKLTDKVQSLLTLCFDKSPEEAVDFLESKGIEISWDWKSQLDLIKKHSFTVAKVSNADILQMFKDELLAALEQGKTYDDFKKEITPLLEDKGYAKREDGSAWQLDNIYRTNLQTSFMAGRWQGQMEVAQDFPFWEYVAVMDSRTRPSHAVMNGTLRRFDDSFWQTHYPQNGYRCRCRVIVYNDRTLSRDNKQITPVPDGAKPDEGFATNPGEIWIPDFTKYSNDIKKVLEQDLK